MVYEVIPEPDPRTGRRTPLFETLDFTTSTTSTMSTTFLTGVRKTVVGLILVPVFRQSC